MKAKIYIPILCKNCLWGDFIKPFVFERDCRKFKKRVDEDATCEYSEARPHTPTICGYRGCDGECYILGTEGVLCKKCGHHFI